VGLDAQSLCRPVRKAGRTYRALNPWSEQDARIMEIVSRGEFALNGFRNRDVRARLYLSPSRPKEQKRQAAAVTRKLRLLRAHGLIRKVSGTHRYVVTERGRQIMTALLVARQADTAQLTAMAV